MSIETTGSFRNLQVNMFLFVRQIRGSCVVAQNSSLVDSNRFEARDVYADPLRHVSQNPIRPLAYPFESSVTLFSKNHDLNFCLFRAHMSSLVEVPRIHRAEILCPSGGSLKNRVIAVFSSVSGHRTYLPMYQTLRACISWDALDTGSSTTHPTEKSRQCGWNGRKWFFNVFTFTSTVVNCLPGDSSINIISTDAHDLFKWQQTARRSSHPSWANESTVAATVVVDLLWKVGTVQKSDIKDLGAGRAM